MGANPEGFMRLLNRLVKINVKTWGVTYREQIADAEEFNCSMEDANVVSSLIVSSGIFPGGRHHLVLDIDHPAWLVKSTTEGHHHLYVEVPGGMDWEKYENLLFALAEAGVIEQGYFEVSKKRNRTDVRLPWIKKESA